MQQLPIAFLAMISLLLRVTLYPVQLRLVEILWRDQSGVIHSHALFRPLLMLCNEPHGYVTIDQGASRCTEM